MQKIRIIEAPEITKAVKELCIEANLSVCADVLASLESAKNRERSPSAIFALEKIIENAAIAKRERLPICQDTGMAVVFLSVGTDAHIHGDITEAVHAGVREGYREGYFRNSVVGDPVRRINTGDNTPAVIHYDLVPGSEVRITVVPKGFGSENMSQVRMLNPSDGLGGIEDFILEAVRLAGAKPCPPIIVGVGIGGTAEKAALLSKQALLREVGSGHADPFWADIEARLLERINQLMIGAAGFGGDTTALGVHILTYPTHIAGLPVAVNIGCCAMRHATRVM